MLASVFDFLFHLPDHHELSAFLTDHGLNLPNESHDHGLSRARRAHDAIHRAPLFTRDRIVADIKRLNMLADEESLGYLLAACAEDKLQQDILRMTSSPALRALWLYRHYPATFEAALEARWSNEALETYTQQRTMPAGLSADRSSLAQSLLAAELSQFFMAHDRCGRTCKTVFCDDTGDGNIEMMIYLDDRAQARLEWIDGEVKLQETTPVRRLAVRYASATGQLNTMASGGAAYHDALMDAFARHILHVDVPAAQHAPVCLPLECVKQPLPLPEDPSLESLSLRELTLVDEATGGELTIKAPAHDAHMDVHALLNRWKLTERLLDQTNFKALAATVGVRIASGAVRQSLRSVALRLKRRGGTNLAVFESAQRTQFESWVAAWCLRGEGYRPGGIGIGRIEPRALS